MDCRVGTAHRIDLVGSAHPTTPTILEKGWHGQAYSHARADSAMQTARASEYHSPRHPAWTVGWARPTASIWWAVPTLLHQPFLKKGGMGRRTRMPVLIPRCRQHGHRSTTPHATPHGL